MKFKMKHIKEIMENNIDLIKKGRFYYRNRDIFLKYFESMEQYQALINAGNFKKMQEIIKQNSSFNLDEFIINFN